jgi:hypothetical protein
MPYFLFNVVTAPGMTMDQEGSWFPDVFTAEKEASAAVRELVADCVKGGIHFYPRQSSSLGFPARRLRKFASEMLPA